jgi:hypothetical protein
MPERFYAALSSGYVSETVQKNVIPDPVTHLLLAHENVRFIGIYSQFVKGDDMLKLDAGQLGLPSHRRRIVHSNNESELGAIRTSLLVTHSGTGLDDVAPQMTNEGYAPVSGRKLIYCAPQSFEPRSLINKQEDTPEELHDLDLLIPTIFVVMTNPHLINVTQELPLAGVIVGNNHEDTRDQLLKILEA